jgi:hypothetical protein
VICLAACSPSSGRVGGTGSGPGSGSGGITPGGGGTGTDPIDNEGKMGPCAKMDILFVVDNSGSMSEEQSNLATNLPKFIDVLDNFKNSAGAELDWRVGVTSTGKDVSYTVVLPPPFSISTPLSEKGENGELLEKMGCGMTRRWIEPTDANGSTEFACNAKLGTNGSGMEMPLETMRMAFDARVKDGTNAGFLRDDALLAVVILTDENDCSRSDNNFTVKLGNGQNGTSNGECDPKDLNKVQDYADFLDQLKGGTGRWATAVVAGPGPGDCMSAFGSAEEATRLKDFVGLAGQNGVFSSICDGDLTIGLHNALETFQAACESFPPIK